MTELINQITHITKEIKELYGDEYSQQYYNASIILINKLNNDLNEYEIIIETLQNLIDDEYKQKQINDLRKKNKEQDKRITFLEDENKTLKIEIKELKEDNKNKDIRIDNLEKENTNLKNRINILETNKNVFDALVKLHECNALVNKEFKRLYRIKFNISKYNNNIPNIGDFIENPPTEEDGDDYIFWIEFNNKYPESNNENFRKIYKQISNDRADSGAHISVRKLTESDFDNLIEIVYPEDYKENKQIYESYRKWLFMFPV